MIPTSWRSVWVALACATASAACRRERPAPSQCERARGAWQGVRFEGAPPIAEADTMLNEASLATRWVLTASSLRRPGRSVAQVMSARDHGGFCALYIEQGAQMPQLIRLFVDARDELHAPQSSALNAPMMVFRRVR